MTTAVLRAIREMRVITAQDALDIVQCLAGKQCSFDTQCLDDCISILGECVSEETLTPEVTKPHKAMELDQYTPRTSGSVHKHIYDNSIA